MTITTLPSTNAIESGVQAATKQTSPSIGGGVKGPTTNFANLVLQPAADAVQASQKADQVIMSSATTGKISDLEFTAAMSEADLAVHKIKAIYGTGMESLKKILDMPA